MTQPPPSSRPPPWFSALLLPGVAALLLVAAGAWLFWTQLRSPPSVTYAQFQTLLDGGQVSRVVVREITATVDLREPARPATVRVRLPSSLAVPDSSLITELETQNVDYRFEAPSQWLGILLNVLPVILLIGVPVFFLTILLLWLLRRRSPPGNLSER
ncbi:ATP-dependent metallopeptidase FtsH/Yme1/Tma family protein [Deinococcus radiopugnans]|uniref:Cell division protease FtsH n=1 Tax=Deinococcus radiopugnans ATCC 19172 TaxID=585398 RepID=A0A5C4Y403_9DEIO|nr:ATP-dependent metallopeptidase FtsH/Yme1/Tma family protein [Deinococcus radiopugnans]MBB6017191.1 cell division protease FtsH [Deinococcus radiopugnans ATCC 19172]TNM70510.1 hypothetical protein FHR04_12655 [Deinococcus radiopugnans ATCC 19172]